jgi:hypothetical protein
LELGSAPDSPGQLQTPLKPIEIHELSETADSPLGRSIARNRVAPNRRRNTCWITALECRRCDGWGTVMLPEKNYAMYLRLTTRRVLESTA